MLSIDVLIFKYIPKCDPRPTIKKKSPKIYHYVVLIYILIS